MRTSKNVLHFTGFENVTIGVQEMTVARWPLLSNTIRQGSTHHTFGMVRNGGTKAHQGWDIYAVKGTNCYAISAGKVVHTGFYGSGSLTTGFGRMVILEFEHDSRTLFAAYCHLSSVSVEVSDTPIGAGTLIGLTGITGNARSMHGKDQHLHFEIRTTKYPGLGLQGRLDPIDVFNECPLKYVINSPLLNPT
jgi:peptidoglycan LD-endopeptidase LytH